MNDAPIPLSYQSPPETPLSSWGIVGWWEYRRLLYNGVLLILGLLIILATAAVSTMDHQDMLPPPLFLAFGIVLYGFCANVCYTGGWILDLAWKEPELERAARRRRGLFIAGLIFSCLVTTVPLWIELGAIALKHL